MSNTVASPATTGKHPITLRERAQLVRRAAPIALSMLASFLLWIEDILMMASVSPLELAGVAVGSSAIGALLFFGRGIIAGFSILMGMSLGRSDQRETVRWYRHGLWMAAFCAFATMLGALLISYLLRFTPISSQTVEIAVGYVLARTPGILPLMLLMVPYAYLISVDRSWDVFWVMLAANVGNVVLNYLFIFGALGFSELGATGCGLATSMTSAMSFVMLLLISARHMRFSIRFLLERPTRKLLARGWAIGWPRGLQQFSERVFFVIMPLWIALWGDLPQAAYQLALVTSTVCHCLALGVGGAVEVTVAICIGGGRVVRAKRAAFSGVSLGAMIGGAFAFVVVFADESLILLLGSGDEDVLPYALPAFMMLSLTLVLSAVATVAGAAVRGSGRTKASFLASAVPQWFVAVPVVYLSSEVFTLGVAGAFIGFSAGALVSSGLFLLLVLSPRFGRTLDGAGRAL